MTIVFRAWPYDRFKERATSGERNFIERINALEIM